MRVVVSHLNFATYSGTETYLLTVAQHLERLGHDTVVYACELGLMAEFARGQGVRVVDDISKLPSSCDAVFAQDACTAYQLAARYPRAARLYGLHSAHIPLQFPPQLQGACHAIVVLNDRLSRRAEGLAHRPQVVRLRQPIDLKRFSLPSAVIEPRRRPRVLALNNHTPGPRQRIVEQACRDAGLELTSVGAYTGWTSSPEHAIAGVEIVISLGRGALEAMAAGRAVYVFGPAGGDGWVTPDSYPAIERDGFSGRAFEMPVDTHRIAADLAGWRDGMGESNRAHAWAHHDGERHAIELVELAERLKPQASPKPVSHAEELARLVRIEWSSFVRAEGAIAENRRIRAQADALGEQARLAGEAARVQAGSAATLTETARSAAERVDQLEQANHDLDARLQALISTRRYRLVCRIVRPLDRVRARWRRALQRSDG